MAEEEGKEEEECIVPQYAFGPTSFETPPSTGRHCCLSAVINAKSLQNRGNTSEKLWRERLGEKKKKKQNPQWR